jgi:hypothetical protein
VFMAPKYRNFSIDLSKFPTHNLANCFWVVNFPVLSLIRLCISADTPRLGMGRALFRAGLFLTSILCSVVNVSLFVIVKYSFLAFDCDKSGHFIHFNFRFLNVAVIFFCCGQKVLVKTIHMINFFFTEFLQNFFFGGSSE